MKNAINFLILSYHSSTIPRGLTVRIAGFHPAGPGSTPGVGTIFAVFRSLRNLLKCKLLVITIARILAKFIFLAFT